MNYFVLATHAVTVDGEWVTPESVQQVDFDSLLCICYQRCKTDPPQRLKIDPGVNLLL